ncbi:MAG: RnfABCDGE type electron transport complex subunit G [Lachnospiraceae bacterium]|nr:RnfABCDGE type electron transport complex subunit G [Lachnospiraceae bacterium]
MSKDAAVKKNSSPAAGIIKDTLIIFAITLIAGLVLGFVYELTKEPIETQKMAKQAAACSEVFKEADENGNLTDVVKLSFEEIPVSETALASVSGNSDVKATVTEVYEATTNDGKRYGYVIAVETSEGYGGNIRFYMGVTMDEILKGISILEIHETPGLGMRASEVLTPQFRNVAGPEFTVTKSGKTNDSEIDAITSATITSKAVTRGVNFGMKYFKAMQEGGVQ